MVGFFAPPLPWPPSAPLAASLHVPRPPYKMVYRLLGSAIIFYFFYFYRSLALSGLLCSSASLSLSSLSQTQISSFSSCCQFSRGTFFPFFSAEQNFLKPPRDEGCRTSEQRAADCRAIPFGRASLGLGSDGFLAACVSSLPPPLRLLLTFFCARRVDPSRSFFFSVLLSLSARLLPVVLVRRPLPSSPDMGVTSGADPSPPGCETASPPWVGSTCWD